jgi:Protein of unknown function (DUF402)
VKPGDAILLRSIYRGNVRWCWPHRYVCEWEGRHGVYCRPGNRGKLMRRVEGKGYLEYWASGAPAFDYVWERSHVLRFMREGDAHTVELFWDEECEFLGWYVNLQAPLTVVGDRFDTTDWALDVWVERDGRWEWKDEDHFAAAVERGFLDAATAAEVRGEAERVVAAKPWPTGWEAWRAPPQWGPLQLPEDWHVV